MAFFKSLSKMVADYKDEKKEIKQVQKEAFEEEKTKVKAEQHKAKLIAAEEKGKKKAHKSKTKVSPKTKAKAKKVAKKVVKKLGSKLKSAAEKAGTASERSAILHEIMMGKTAEQKGERKVLDMYPKRTGKPPSLDEIWGIKKK